MTSVDLRRAENSAGTVRFIFALFIVIQIIGTVILASDSPSYLQKIVYALGTMSVLSLFLINQMWGSIYLVLFHIADPKGSERKKREGGVESRNWECENNCGFNHKEKDAVETHEKNCPRRNKKS